MVGEAGWRKKTVSNNCNITVLYDCKNKIVMLPL